MLHTTIYHTTHLHTADTTRRYLPRYVHLVVITLRSRFVTYVRWSTFDLFAHSLIYGDFALRLLLHFTFSLVDTVRSVTDFVRSTRSDFRFTFVCSHVTRSTVCDSVRSFTHDRARARIPSRCTTLHTPHYLPALRFHYTRDTYAHLYCLPCDFARPVVY